MACITSSNPSADTRRALDRRTFLASAGVFGGLAAVAGLTGGARITLASEGTSASEDASAEAASDAPDIDWRETDVNALVEGGANIALATTYGIYSMEGDSVDSAITCAVYYDLDSQQIADVEFDEVLLPFSVGGADAWAVVDEDTAAKLGDATLALGDLTYAQSFEIGGITWTGTVVDDAIEYTADIDGAQTSFLDYVATQEGGAWYHEAYTDGATLLDASGAAAATVEIGTKESIGHGVDFWASPITFPGNIQLIKNYLYDYGTDYAYEPDGDDIAKNDDGVWVVCDTVTGATLNGAPNYFNLAKQAVEAIEGGEYELVQPEGAASSASASAEADAAASK